MIKIFLKHKLAEIAINTVFDEIHYNFSRPDMNNMISQTLMDAITEVFLDRDRFIRSCGTAFDLDVTEGDGNQIIVDITDRRTTHIEYDIEYDIDRYTR